MANLKELSKQNFNVNREVTFEQINCGSLQRIADATELMASNFLKLQKDNEYLNRSIQSLNKENERLRRSACSYKGKYNNLKNNQCK